MKKQVRTQKKSKTNGHSGAAIKPNANAENRQLKRKVASLEKECQVLRKTILKMIPITVPVDDKSLTKMLSEPTVDMGAFIDQLRSEIK